MGSRHATTELQPWTQNGGNECMACFRKIPLSLPEMSWVVRQMLLSEEFSYKTEEFSVCAEELLVTNLCCFAVYADGSICLDILQNRWSPTYDVSSILTSIQVGLCSDASQLHFLWDITSYLGPPAITQ